MKLIHPRRDVRAIVIVLIISIMFAGVPWKLHAVELGSWSNVDVTELFDMSLEELMEVRIDTMSRIDERLDEAPGTIYVFSRELIQARGYRSLAELLQVVPGFTVFHRDLQFVVGVRGLNANDNDKVSLLVNGQRVLGMHEQEFLNGPINLENAKRVEVVVGPSSLYQQGNTLAATINIITKKTQGVETSVATGSDLVYSGTLMTGKMWSLRRYVDFSLTLEKKEGFNAWDRPSRLSLPGSDITGQLNWPSFFGVLNGRSGEFSAQTVAYRSSLPELHIEGADPQNDGKFVEQYYSVLLKNEHSWTPAVISVVSLEGAIREQTRLNDNGPPINAVEITSKQRLLKTDIGVRYIGFDRHLIQLGTQASYADNYDTYFTFLSPDQSGAIPKTTLVNKDPFAAGFYLDDTFKINDRVKLIAGSRIDWNQRLDNGHWYPGWRSALVVRPVNHWVSKIVYNRAVRMPSSRQSLNEVWGSNNPTDDPGNPSFAQLSPTAGKPERLTTLELQNIFYFMDARLGTTLYHQKLDDFITWFQPWSNGGDFSGNGVEVSLHTSLNPQTTFWANAAYNNSKLHLFRPEVFGPVSNTPENFHAYVNPDNRIIGSAKYTANLGFDHKIVDGLTLSPSIRYFTEQAAVEFRTQAEGGPEFRTIHNQFYVDASLVWRNWKFDTDTQMDFSLSGYNLANNRDEVGAQLFGDAYRPRGISWVLEVEVRF